MKIHRLITVACAAGLLLASQASAQDDKCRDAVNNGSRKVHQQEAKGNRKACVKDQTGDQTACVNADQPKSTDQAGKLTDKYNDKCSTLPAFGVNASVADIINAAQDAADNTVKAVFGDPVDGLDNANKCHDKLAKRPGDLTTAQWKAFRKCVKDGEPHGSIASIEACIGSGIAAGTAGKGQKVIDDANDNCDLTAGEAPGTDDGDCADTGAGFGQCIIDHAECEVCKALNTVTGGNANCATVSGIACSAGPVCGNGIIEGLEACDPPGIESLDCGGGQTCDNTCQCVAAGPSHKCTFDEATDNSDLDLRVGGNGSLAALVDPIAGAVDITCDANTQLANGKRSCKCELQTWTPVAITGIGFVCLEPGPACPTGEIDCNGGNALGIEAEDSSEIGACTGHGDCSTQCDTFCGGLGKVQWRSGCENFCQGGIRDGLACICDTWNGGGCAGGIDGVNDCPGGSCVGKNNEADTDCQCQCIDYSVGGASAAGTLQCQLSSDIKVVASLPCANPALVDLPPICAPFSSQETTGTTSPANENAPGPGTDIGPNTLNGTPETCANIDASTTTGFTLVGDFGFMDSTIGDIRTPFTLDCQ